MTVLPKGAENRKLSIQNGIIILNKNARTILIVPISAELLNVSLLKTISPIIKTITSKTDFALKYQQTKDNNGETAVNPNQIIA